MTHPVPRGIVLRRPNSYRGKEMHLLIIPVVVVMACLLVTMSMNVYDMVAKDTFKSNDEMQLAEYNKQLEEEHPHRYTRRYTKLEDYQDDSFYS